MKFSQPPDTAGNWGVKPDHATRWPSSASVKRQDRHPAAVRVQMVPSSASGAKETVPRITDPTPSFVTQLAFPAQARAWWQKANLRSKSVEERTKVRFFAKICPHCPHEKALARIALCGQQEPASMRLAARFRNLPALPARKKTSAGPRGQSLTRLCNSNSVGRQGATPPSGSSSNLSDAHPKDRENALANHPEIRKQATASGNRKRV